MRRTSYLPPHSVATGLATGLRGFCSCCTPAFHWREAKGFYDRHISMWRSEPCVCNVGNMKTKHHFKATALVPSSDVRVVRAGGTRTIARIAARQLWVLSAIVLMSMTSSGAADESSAQVPEWAQPGSATHQQVAPPSDFHRPTTTFNTPIGIFEGQSDIGSAVVPGSASFDPKTKQYTINSAGYNIWYTRDEFRYLWKKMSGDVSLAADISYPNANGYGDRKAVLVIRQDLDDDSKEAMVALHGEGLIHIAYRPDKGVRVKDTEYRVGGRGRPGGKSPDSLVTVIAKRIGIEKRGNEFALFVSLEGEPMHQFGPPITLELKAPFYVGIGFCSHLPATVDTAVLSHVVLENKAGKVR
jgi:hypothetical protein